MCSNPQMVAVMRVTIASGKGGTGKTTLSTNLSAYLASQNKKVTLVDLDVEEPNDALFFSLMPNQKETCFVDKPVWESENCIFCNECTKRCHFNSIIVLPNEVLIFPNLCHSCHACSELCENDALVMTPHKVGMKSYYDDLDFKMVEGRLDVGQEMAIPLISDTIKYATTFSDEDTLMILDAPPGTSCSVIEASKSSDFVLLVTEPTVFGLNDLKLAVETMKILDKPMGVIINRDGIGDNSVKDYCLDENIPIIATIKNDKEVAKLYSNGELAYKDNEHFRNSIKDVATFIEGIQ